MLNRVGLRLCVTLLAGGLAAPCAFAGTYAPLYQFTGGNDGATPPSSLAYDEKGDLYGVAENGGKSCSDDQGYGCGTVYEISPSGQATTLVTFTGANGAIPKSPLTLVNHTLYGSAVDGGANDYGVLFSVRADGTKFTLLHTFAGKDGYAPFGPLVPGPKGAFYGLASGGGPNRRSAYAGVLFELMPDGTYIQLHDFTGGADGGGPNALTIDASGTLYGSTNDGSPCPGATSCGVVFAYVPSTGAFTVLHQFTKAEGRYPMVGSIGPDGTVYGATRYGERYDSGSLFELVPAGGKYSLTTLYLFQEPPSAGPILTSYGALIGTTTTGNPGDPYPNGTLYRYKYNRMETLYGFPTYTDAAPPTLDKNGIIYGAGSGGGITPCNTPGTSLSLGCGFLYSFVQSQAEQARSKP